jgi:hypothetical protein
MPWMSLLGAFAALMTTVSGQILVARHKERSVFVITWARLALLSGALLLIMKLGGGVRELAMVAALATAITTVGCVLYLPRVLDVSAFRLLAELGRAFGIGAIMFLGVRACHWSGAPFRLVSLTLDSLLAALIYVSLVMVTWHYAGRPDGPEKRALQLVKRRSQRLNR